MKCEESLVKRNADFLRPYQTTQGERDDKFMQEILKRAEKMKDKEPLSFTSHHKVDETYLNELRKTIGVVVKDKKNSNKENVPPATAPTAEEVKAPQPKMSAVPNGSSNDAIKKVKQDNQPPKKDPSSNHAAHKNKGPTQQQTSSHSNMRKEDKQQVAAKAA